MRQVIINVWVFRQLMMIGILLATAGAGIAQQVVNPQKEVTSEDSSLIKELYTEGMEQKSTGQLALAEKTFDKLVSLQPNHDAAHFELAEIHMEKEDYTAAEREAKRAAAINPDNDAYWSILLDIYKKTRNANAMPAVFDELIRIYPDTLSNYQEKAYVLFITKQYDASLAVCDTIASRFGETEEQHLTKSQIYLAQNDVKSATNELELLVVQKPKDVKGYILLAELYTKSKESRKAIKLLDEASASFPDEPLILLGKSDALLAMGKQKPAYELLRQVFGYAALDIDAKAGVLYAAIANRDRRLAPEFLTGLADLLAQTYPQEVKAYAVKGDVYMQMRKPEDAQQAYLKALDINQYIEGIWQQLLQVELQMGEYNDVEQHGQRALKLFPNRPMLLFFTGHGFMGSRNYQEARVYLEGALNAANEQQTPLLTQLYSNLGDVYNALEMYAESGVAYEEAIALDSTNAYALNNYAYYLALRKENLTLASEMSKKSNELMPDYASYQDTYAWVFFQQEKYEEALEWIRKAIKNSETVSDTLLEHYGDILAKRGDLKEAVVQWKKALTMSKSAGKDIDKLSKKIDARKFID